MLITITALALLAAGCQSPPANRATATTKSLPAGMPMQDVRTEATIIEMENEYIAGKNSPPPRPEQAAAMKRMEEKKKAETKAGK